jgi:WD40 repeat protein
MFPLVSLALAALASAAPIQARDTTKGRDSAKTPDKCDSLCVPPARTISFETTEGTWMSLDVSPDGRTILFDLLGDIYTVPLEGGAATRITSGMMWDYHPVFSPDGKKIAYITDRTGSKNIWVMDADGKNPKQITKDRDQNFTLVEWSPDGDYLTGRRGGGVWIYHRSGGSGMEMAKNASGAGYTFSSDGRYLYFGARGFGGGTSSWQIKRLDRQTADIATITESPVGAFRPIVSPDGKWLVYGSRVDAKTGLRIRNLESDDDTWLLFPIDRDEGEGFGAQDALPRYDFTPDGKSIILATGGTFHRLDLATKKPTKIAFSAKVEQSLGALTLFPVKLTNDPFTVKGLRYVNSNPAKTQLALAR